ncbi:MAG: D-2-hydroxyacid dehydrogenase [Cytophagaceae bacterium]
MKIVFLDAKTVGDIPEIKLLERFGLLEVHEVTLQNNAMERCADADIIITNKVIIDRNIIEQSKYLKLICVAATGMNNIDLIAAEEHNVKVKNVKGYSTDSVAQHTFAMLFNLLHQITYYDQFVKSGAYSDNDIFTHLAREYYVLKDKVFGIIGLGSIGMRVAEIARVFGAEVVYHSTSGNNLDQPYRHYELKELLAMSDIVSIHAPLNETTFNLLGYGEFAHMKRNAILINTGRGGIVNETDLAKALDDNLLFGAALDVFNTEPPAKDNPLLLVNENHRILFTPHIAWAGKEARISLLQGISNNIEEFIASQN